VNDRHVPGYPPPSQPPPGEAAPSVAPPGGHPGLGPPRGAPERPEGLGPPLDPPPPASASGAAPGWGPWTAPLALVTGFAIALVGAVVIGAIAAAFGASLSDPPPSVNIIATVVQDLGLVAAAVFFAKRVVTPRPWQFGLRPTRVWKAAGWMAATWVAFFILSAIWVAALGIDSKDDLPDALGADKSQIALAAVCILVTVIAPICEEFFFRGYFFSALKTWRGFWPAAILTGLTFGGIHAGSSPVGYLVPLAVFGFGLCWLYQRTCSLLPCIALHALNNSLAFGVTQHWDWQIPLLMIGANLAIATILWPIVKRDRPVPGVA
jgi:membrane protease YdiL (CAAX protease family)